ncbi:sensor domain-containing diguanylate cyclase [Bacillus sp. Gen3]|nr:sensor domain-containing diguanylate cyclase [Bacillus sp. Gen3]
MMHDHNCEELMQLKFALEQSVMMVEINRDGKFIYVNDCFCRNTEYSRKELISQDIQLLDSNFYTVISLRETKELMEKGEKWEGDIYYKTKNGEVVWVEAVIVPVLNRDGQLKKLLAIFTEKIDKTNVQMWRNMAYHDELTNLPNRRMLNLVLDSSIVGSDKQQEKLAILFMDINYFKKINDTYGHWIGDQLLKAVGERLNRIAFIKDRIFRQSGDEFIILLQGIEDLDKQLESIISLFYQPFHIDSYSFEVSVSIGVSLYPDHGNNHDILLRYADIAMFHSKSRKGNTYLLYHSSMSSELPSRLTR